MNPLSDLNTFHQQLSHALNLAKLDSNNHQVRNYYHEVEFFIDQCQVVLSTQKDPYRQIASLQQFFKTAKIKGLRPVFVDLSSSHPYATLKNN